MDTNQTIPNSFFESFWGTEEDEITSEVRDFYINFLEHNDKLKSEILSYDFLEDKKKYTVYNIKVTTDYFSFTIQKRFSLFLRLKDDLKDKYPDLNLNRIQFPSKTYFSFGSRDIEIIEKRRILLNGFIQLLVENCKKLTIVEFLDFLEIKNRTELAFNNQTSYPFLENLYTNNTQEVTKLVQYLDLLNKNPDDTSKILKEMESFYISARPKIGSEVIKALLVGKQKAKGLVHFCGKFDPETNSHLICAVGLKFLIALMDHQTCQDADQFTLIFSSLDPKMLALLNLSEHIEGKAQRQCKGAALKLADIYITGNPKLPPSDIEFEKWRLTNKMTSIKSEGYQVSGAFDDNKDAIDFSTSPQSTSYNSLDDVSSNITKLFPVGKLDWSSLYRDDSIKIKYYRSKYLSITLRTSSTLKACSSKLDRGVDYRMLCEESKIIKELDLDTNIHLVKTKFHQPPYRHLVFMSEKKIEEIPGDRIVVLERPCKDYSIMLNGSELLVKRFANVVIKKVLKATEKTTKIKMLVKNLDDGSRSLQEYLLKEDGGKLILEGCKKYLADVELDG